jgi:hydrogenase maturation protein HypF
MRVVKLAKLIAAIIEDVRVGVPASRLSLKFHMTVAQVVCEMCSSISKDTGIKVVALSGGVFQNRLLARLVVEPLEADGVKVLTHRDVPCNDGCIALGQAVVANFALSR